MTRANRAATAKENKSTQEQASGVDARVAELEELVRQLRAALEARGRRVVTDQMAYADQLQAQNLVIARLQEDIRILEAEIEGRKRAYQDLVNTRTFRYSARVRELYGTIRKWFPAG